jgi:hypothetical protein
MIKTSAERQKCRHFYHPMGKMRIWWRIGNTSNANRLYQEANNQFFLVDTGYDVIFKETEEVVTDLTIVVQPGFEREFKKF